MIDIESLLNDGVPNEFIEVPPGSCMPTVFSILGLLLRKWGGSITVTQSELEGIAGAFIKVYMNYKTKEVKLVLSDPHDDVWKKVTPGIEAGHA